MTDIPLQGSNLMGLFEVFSNSGITNGGNVRLSSLGFRSGCKGHEI